MVTFSHGGHEHDHGSGETCPGCQFRQALADHLAWAAQDGEESWHAFTGELIVLMGTALSELTALRGAAIDGVDAPDDSADAAAASISRLGGVIDELWHTVMDEPQPADDGE